MSKWYKRTKLRYGCQNGHTWDLPPDAMTNLIDFCPTCGEGWTTMGSAYIERYYSEEETTDETQ